MADAPLYPNGLAYLFGVYDIKDGEKLFKPFWAHDHEEKKETFKRVMGLLAGPLAEHPRAQSMAEKPSSC